MYMRAVLMLAHATLARARARALAKITREGLYPRVNFARPAR